MRVVGLCETITRAVALHQRLSGVPGIHLDLLVCNNSRLPPPRFGRALAGQWRRLNGRDRWLALRLLAAGRLRVCLTSVHSQEALRWLRRRSADVGLHAMGVIYRRPLLDCFRLGVLNPHIGLLPGYRGRSVMEWSIFNGDPTGISTFFLDEGIDTGRDIVRRDIVDVGRFGDLLAAKQHLWSLGDAMFAAALRDLQKPEFQPLVNDGSGKRYYVMSDLFQRVVVDLMRTRQCAE